MRAVAAEIITLIPCGFMLDFVYPWSINLYVNQTKTLSFPSNKFAVLTSLLKLFFPLYYEISKLILPILVSTLSFLLRISFICFLIQKKILEILRSWRI